MNSASTTTEKSKGEKHERVSASVQPGTGSHQDVNSFSSLFSRHPQLASFSDPPAPFRFRRHGQVRFQPRPSCWLALKPMATKEGHTRRPTRSADARSMWRMPRSKSASTLTMIHSGLPWLESLPQERRDSGKRVSDRRSKPDPNIWRRLRCTHF
jgi:hypothetical protein